MVSTNLPVCIKNSNASQILIFGGYVKVSESFVCLSYYLGQYHSKPD